MTVAEFRDRLPEDPVILLPLGSQEEQGPHAPMGDYQLAEAVALRAAELSGAIAAPCLPFGYAEFFRGFPGGIQLRAATFCAVLEDMLGAFLDHGIERLLILNGHSTNAFLIDQVARKLRRERGVAIASVDLWRAIPDSLWTRLYGDKAAAARGHGADPLTSLAMYLQPAAMRPDLIRPSAKGRALGLPMTGVAGISFGEMPVGLPLNADEVNPDGMMGGDAHLASAAHGEAIFTELTRSIAKLVAHLKGCDMRDPLAREGAR
ncbi:creatininase family protein [Paracoccus pacificus]|uniref:Creatininase family protein n=2 Tax=Paracoccus pacificus TaxID=1463598 RepID=A0ABW4RA62_9RHOB